MANTNDPKCPTTLNYVLHAFRTERHYQLHRWGTRQPDGSFTETPHSVADFIVYMQDYYEEARHRASRDAGLATSLESLRKVVCLGFACLEQCGPYTFDGFADCIRRTGCIVPLTLLPDYSNYLLKIASALANATKYAECFDNEMAMFCIRELVKIGVECFEQFGIEPRDLSQPILNARDGQPA